MNRCGIDKACVSSIDAVFYQDTMEANRALMREIEGLSDRFLPFGVIHPGYPGWEQDFEECFDRMGMKGLALHPNYHGYTAELPEVRKLLHLAASRHIPVRLTARLVDIRGRGRLDTPENLTAGDMESFLQVQGDAAFILSALGPGEGESLAARIGSRSNVFFDFMRLDCFACPSTFHGLLRQAGANRMVVGTGMPFQYPEPQWVKLYFSDLSEVELDQITSQNIRNLLL